MAHQEHHEYHSDQQYNSSQWELTCSQCFKTISSTRPPVYNPENCSCIDLGGLTLDENSYSPSQPYAEHNGGANYAYYQNAQSYASSNLGSINCPEGPEREDPANGTYMHDTNGYTNGDFHPLPICPPLGLNEERHRRFSSSSYEMSYQLRRFLDAERETYYPNSFPPTPAASKTQYLSQDLYIQSQRAEKQGGHSKRSYRSKSSGRGGGSGDSGVGGLGADPMVGMGAWDEDFEEDGYPMVMSGLTDLGSDE